MIPLRDRNPTRRTPFVTWALIGACFVAFAIELSITASSGDRALEAFFREWGAVPAEITDALEAGTYLGQATFGMFTSMFLHGGWLHLLGNMLFLWIFGNNVEDRLGSIPFLLFYLVGGIAAALTQVVDRPALDGAARRRVGRDRRGAGRVHRPVPRRADPVARVPRLLLPAARGAGDHRPRASGSRSSSSTDSRRSAPRRRRAASRSSRTSAGSSFGLAVGLLLRVVGGRHGTGRSGVRPDGIIRGVTRLVEMQIESVRVHMLSNRHVVILKDNEGDRYLPIWIGAWEASAIAMRLQGLAAERPLTHDLFAAALDRLGVRVERVVISELDRRDLPRPNPPRARRRPGGG